MSLAGKRAEWPEHQLARFPSRRGERRQIYEWPQGPVCCRMMPLASGRGADARPHDVVGNRDRALGAFFSIMFILHIYFLRSRKAVYLTCVYLCVC